jgi:hypothetical protein
VHKVAIDDETYQYVAFAARATGMTEAEVLARAVAALREAPLADARSDTWAERPIYGEYRGQRVTALFLPATRRVTVTSEPLAGSDFRSPSAAASAVVAALNDGREMHRVNGMRFWRDVASGVRLEALANSSS